jgi:hypothetical protein
MSDHPTINKVGIFLNTVCARDRDLHVQKYRTANYCFCFALTEQLITQKTWRLGAFCKHNKTDFICKTLQLTSKPNLYRGHGSWHTLYFEIERISRLLNCHQGSSNIENGNQMRDSYMLVMGWSLASLTH